MIAQRIITLRKRSGLTQAELAKKLNITPSALGNYEQGRRLPCVETLIAMAELFDVSLDYLLTGTEHNANEVSSTKHPCPCPACAWAFLTQSK